jgi:hypothetical protein
MAAENPNHIGELDENAPTGAAPKSEGDDHIRAIKRGIKKTFMAIGGVVTASHTELNLLKGKTNVATLQDIANAQLTATLPGVNDPANADKFLKGGGTWSTVDLRGAPTKDKGNTGTTAQVINYADGEGQTITATGAHTLTATGFPEGRMAGILLRMRGYGNFALTTTGITWIKADGTETTNFATSGITLSTGTTHVAMFTHGDGIVYGKVAR